MATFTIAPDFGAQASIKPRTLTAQYGDGYAQRTLDGLNPRGEEWQLTFSARTPTEVSSLLAFFNARNGVEPFDWTSPSGVVGRWVCPEWSYQPANKATGTVTAKFVQDFNP